MTEHRKCLKLCLEGLEIGNPVGHQNLTLVPLMGSDRGKLDYILAAEAIENHTLEVTEVGYSGRVPELLVKNKAEKMVLMLDGEELVGAKQNRILNTTIMIPGGKNVKIPVSCVEQGRWRSVSEVFASGGYAPSALRACKSRSVSKNLRDRKRAESNQGEIWNQVARLAAETETRSSTMAMSDVVKQQQESLESYVNALDYVPDSRGVVAAITENFAVLDLFDKAATLQSIWKRLITGYAVDAIVRNPGKTPPFTGRQVQNLLEHIGQLQCRVYPSVGLGEDWRFESGDVLGQALVVDDTCVHLGAFPSDGRQNHNSQDSRIMNPSFRCRRRID